MQLYFSPLAASFAARTVAYEAGLDLEYIQVDRATKELADGSDYRDLHPPGLVPALRLDDGTLLTENPVILAHLAEPAAHLTDSLAVRQWLSFIATELHKAVFHPIFDTHAPPEVAAYALVRAQPRLGYVEQHLRERDHLAESLSAADLYLATMLMWTRVTPIDLKARYPALKRFLGAIAARPSFVRAREEELPLFGPLPTAG